MFFFDYGSVLKLRCERACSCSAIDRITTDNVMKADLVKTVPLRSSEGGVCPRAPPEPS